MKIKDEKGVIHVALWYNDDFGLGRALCEAAILPMHVGAGDDDPTGCKRCRELEQK